METIPGEELFVFTCAGTQRHRVTRKTVNNPARCSFCGYPFLMSGSVTKDLNENDADFQARAIRLGRKS